MIFRDYYRIFSDVFYHPVQNYGPPYGQARGTIRSIGPEKSGMEMVDYRK
jgi:hypothetical protein